MHQIQLTPEDFAYWPGVNDDVEGFEMDNTTQNAQLIPKPFCYERQWSTALVTLEAYGCIGDSCPFSHISSGELLYLQTMHTVLAILVTLLLNVVRPNPPLMP